MSTFLSEEELRVLTGRTQKSKQVEQLRKMGIPFFFNAAGRPVVSTQVVNGMKPAAENKNWSPKAWVGNAMST